MASYEIMNIPNMAKDYAVSGLKVIKPPKLSFKVEVDFDDKVFKMVKDDSILLGEMNAAAKKIYDQTCKGIQSKLSAFEKLMQGMVDKGSSQAECDKQLDGLNNSIVDDKAVAISATKMAIEAVWKKYQAKKSDYLKFKIKIGVNIAGAAAGLAVSIGLMASSAFSGGASAAFGIIGMIKSCATIGGEIAKAAMEVEKAQKVLEVHVKAVVAAYQKHAALGKANEYTSAIVTQFLGVSQPSIKSVGEQMNVVEQKLNQIEIRLHDASVTLNKILDKQEKMKGEFMKEVATRLGKHPNAQVEMKTIQAKLDGVMIEHRSVVMAQIGTVHQLHERWKKADAAAEVCRPKVEQLLAMRGVDVKIFENLLYFVDLPLAALDGNVVAKSVELTKGLVSCASNMAYDKIKGVALDKSILV